MCLPEQLLCRAVGCAPLSSSAAALASALRADRWSLARSADGTLTEFWDLRFRDEAAADRFLRDGEPALEADGWTARSYGRDVRLRRDREQAS